MQRQSRTGEGPGGTTITTDTAETAGAAGTRGLATTGGSASPPAQEQAGTAEETRPPRVRMGRKRTRFAHAPRPAPAVKALWTASGSEERAKAHRTCMAILEYWLGKKTKAEAARGLGVAPLRVWQLSQLALSGMMAGLLRQPRSRARPAALPPPPENDPTKLKRRIVELERKLARTEDLVRVLQDLPWKPAREVGDGRKPRAAGSKPRTSRSRGRGRQTSAPGAGRAAPGDRTAAAGTGTDRTS
jgi:hypothetical protein